MAFEKTPAKASVATPDFLKPVLPVHLSPGDVKDSNSPETPLSPGDDSLHSVTRVSVADDPLSMFAAPAVTTKYELVYSYFPCDSNKRLYFHATLEHT